MEFSSSQFFIGFLLELVVLGGLWLQVSSFGSMSSMAASFGDKGNAFCGLKPDGSHTVTCNGSNSAIIHDTPAQFQFLGLTGGYGFLCGILMSSKQPYCWGRNGHIAEKLGVPQPMVKGAQYLEISAGDNHLCGLRKPLIWRKRERKNTSVVDCWGFNMTRTYVFDGMIQSISAGCGFNCGLFSQNRTAFCWGNHDANSLAILAVPCGERFRKLAAGGNHVCGILEGVNSRTVCWGRSLDVQMAKIASKHAGQGLGNVLLPPNDPMISIAGGRFHACGIKSNDLGVVCWGHTFGQGTPVPSGTKITDIVAGDYFNCANLAEKSDQILCWGVGFSSSLPKPAALPRKCNSNLCPPGSYEMKQHKDKGVCNSSDTHFCVPCSGACPYEMYQISPCNSTSDRICEYNCSACVSLQCFSICSPSPLSAPPTVRNKDERFWSLQVPVLVAEIVFAIFLVSILSTTAVLYVRYKLRDCQCSATRSSKVKKHIIVSSSLQKENSKIRPEIRKAKKFNYEELERATSGFKEENIVGKGSFSCVFKGVLKDGTVVAVKRAIRSQKSSNELHTELDLLSRLNHAHLLSLLGYCEEGGEIILVYEFMAHGSLHQHLHGQNKELKQQLDWVKRVTIAVQAARGIEYLHGYACPPVIHRDIKSSNILIDEEHNARVADFGLSLLGPADSSTPLAELPAGTLGYLDPEYYRLHYLTTKSDVYSFGVLLLELLSGRKAIDMQYEEGNIVQWAKPLIKSGDIAAILDPVLKPPPDLAALKKVAIVACKSVRMRGRDRPSMDKITTTLEHSLARLMGSPCIEQPILPTEVVLGSSRLHMKSSQRSSNRSEIDVGENEDQRYEFRAPSWITFPSVTSSQRIKSSSSEAEVDVKNNNNNSNVGSGGDVLKSLEEEIGPASPQERLFLQHNF
ncbi:Serine threonine-protein kinase-like protein [Stylosanthes scabra]|uniref:Serine threonine-protein kinase-like protein n=1 Tax=Stylosanthes scabra TaxID=79078 RepID=A0ABU6Y9S1_9FABA|nr:Serine threonine-protein kinase-like protein [Stylosanthes scabra]